MPAGWHEISHIGVNDLLFALGLREAGRRREYQPGTRAGAEPTSATDAIGALQYGGEEGDTDGEGARTSQACKSRGCVERDEQLKAILMRWALLQEAFVRAQRRHAAADAKAAASEALRDEKAEELNDLSRMLLAAEEASKSLKAVLSSAKARYACLEDFVQGVSKERVRLRREDLRDSMPSGLQKLLPACVDEATKGLNFSPPPSRLTRQRRRPETVFAILEDGLPGGRLETRDGDNAHGGALFSEETRTPLSPPDFAQDKSALPVWPTTPPRCRRGKYKFPPLQLAVSPIQSTGEVGGVKALNEGMAMSRRERRRAMVRARAAEWWGDYRGDDGSCGFQDSADHRSTLPMAAKKSSTFGRSKRRAWGNPSRLPPPPLSPMQPYYRSTDGVLTV